MTVPSTHAPTDPFECPECGEGLANLTPLPHPDMDEMGDTPPTSLVVPVRCDECGTDFEALYQYDEIGY